jgi:membrane protein YdbS with pleckstrin-like domain
MVGPSLTDEEQRVASMRFKIAFVLVVGFSAGIIAFQTQGSLVQVAVATVAGIVLGVLLIVYLASIVPTGGK